MDGEIPDRVPLSDSYWQTTLARWAEEGLPQDVPPNEHFGTDEIVFISGDYSLQLPERTIEQSAMARTYWDSDGALRRDLHTPDGWTSQWLDFKIKGRDDWRRLRPQLAYNDSRIPDGALEQYHKAKDAAKFVCFGAHACFHPTWSRIGMERELILMLEEPDFMHEMYAAHVDLVIEIFEAMRKRGMRFDGARMADDLGYQASPLISPALYRELVYPHHKRLCDHFAERGLKTMLHSDGNIAPLIPHFLAAGFAALHPLEVKAGLDLSTLREQYGKRLILFGNIDVRKLAGTREEIEEEIGTKLRAAGPSGGYIYHSDHSVPNNVSLDNYRFALDMVRRLGRYE